jgi:hypothetical protein
VLRLARVDLEAQPRGHAAAAVLHIRLAKARVLVARSGPAQTLGALRGVAASGGWAEGIRADSNNRPTRSAAAATSRALCVHQHSVYFRAGGLTLEPRPLPVAVGESAHQKLHEFGAAGAARRLRVAVHLNVKGAEVHLHDDHGSRGPRSRSWCIVPRG